MKNYCDGDINISTVHWREAIPYPDVNSKDIDGALAEEKAAAKFESVESETTTTIVAHKFSNVQTPLSAQVQPVKIAA